MTDTIATILREFAPAPSGKKRCLACREKALAAEVLRLRVELGLLRLGIDAPGVHVSDANAPDAHGVLSEPVSFTKAFHDREALADTLHAAAFNMDEGAE
jgi:hypothetical protein